MSPFSLLFFGGDITIQKDQGDETVAVDQWIVFKCPARIAHLVKVGNRPVVRRVSRAESEASNPCVFHGQSLKTELDSLLEEKILSPAPVDWQNSQSKDCAVISAIIDLITTQEQPAAGGSRGCDPVAPPRGQHLYFDDDEDD